MPNKKSKQKDMGTGISEIPISGVGAIYTKAKSLETFIINRYNSVIDHRRFFNTDVGRILSMVQSIKGMAYSVCTGKSYITNIKGAMVDMGDLTIRDTAKVTAGMLAKIVELTKMADGLNSEIDDETQVYFGIRLLESEASVFCGTMQEQEEVQGYEETREAEPEEYEELEELQVVEHTK
jgi:hypothetical protein